MAGMRWIRIFYVVLAVQLTSAQLSAHEVFIIVPGTWADVTMPGIWTQKQAWYRPDGDFFRAFTMGLPSPDDTVIPFKWSGGNTHKERVEAAHELAQLIIAHGSVNLVGHSHGTNIGIIASQILGQQGLKSMIKNFYALATPVSPTDYLPNMDVIDYLYHLFAFEDAIQTVLGQFKRVFPSHPRIANIRVILKGKAIDHTTAHDPHIGLWLPLFSDIAKKALDSLHLTDFSAPLIAYFAALGAPRIELDPEREDLLALDTRFQENLAVAFGRKKAIA